MSHDELLDRKQAAAFLRISPQTLAVWASVGRYNLPLVKIGRCVRYKKSALVDFIERRTIGNAQ